MKSPILFYQTSESNVNVEVTYLNESFWLTQKTMSQLFNVESNTITYLLKEIFKSQEISEVSTTRKIRVVQKEGNPEVNSKIDFYKLDAIIAVGYQVNSVQATQFRI